jgi:hypothetical protein
MSQILDMHCSQPCWVCKLVAEVVQLNIQHNMDNKCIEDDT